MTYSVIIHMRQEIYTALSNRYADMIAASRFDNILSGLVSFFTPRLTTVDEQTGYYHHLFVSTGLITSAFSFLYVTVSQIIGFTTGVTLMSLCFLFLLAILVLFRKTAQYRLSANLYLACCAFVAILGCSFYSGGIYSMVLPWFTLVPLTAVLLLGPSVDTALWTLLTCLMVFIFGLAGMFDYPFPLQYDTRYTDFFNMICIVGLVMILSILAYVFGNNRKHAMATIEQQKISLERALSEIEHLAFHDTLTQLPNRRLFLERLELAIAESHRNGRYGALMFLDLDDFKPVNDIYGHEAGDKLLVEAAQRLKSTIREVDTVARFGGDEFAIILNMLDPDADTAHARAITVAQKISDNLSAPYILPLEKQRSGHNIAQHQCSASIGIVLFPDNGSWRDELLSKADEAMYKAKSLGKNAIQFHTQD